MIDVKEYIETVTRASKIVPLWDNKTGGRGSAVIVYNENGNISEINISSSLITRFYHNGNKLDICPLKMFVTHIDKQYPFEETNAMRYGKYLESLLLGCTADGEPLTDLPRDKRTGNKSVYQKRIEQHASLWDMRKEQYGIIVNKEGDMKNIQMRTFKKWESKNFSDITINIYATADLISPFKDNGINYDMAIIDIKGTGDVNNTFGNYCWGNPQNIDPFQLVLYSRIFDIPKTLFIVMDWSKNVGFKIVPINVDPNHNDPIKSNEAKLRIKTMEQTIDSFIADLAFYDKSGWKAEPTKDNCKGCKHIYCENYNKTFEI
jgi:hypothetical protein